MEREIKKVERRGVMRGRFRVVVINPSLLGIGVVVVVYRGLVPAMV